MTHWRWLKSAPRSRWIAGSATFTTVMSSNSMKMEMQTTRSVHHLRSMDLIMSFDQSNRPAVCVLPTVR